MTTISAKIVADSIAARSGKRLTSMLLRYPRPIHAELMTHRVFSRNASSSRAIPVERLIQQVIDDPFVPIHWGKNQPGMQAHEETSTPVIVFDDAPRFTREGAWLAARDEAVRFARAFAAAGYHKQIVNRLLEPFAHITVLVSSTEWDNWFALRNHPDAEPHIQLLAQEMLQVLGRSTPRELGPTEWHLPFADGESTAEEVRKYLREALQRRVSGRELTEGLLKVSAARCARTSYDRHDGSRSVIAEDVALHDKLVVAKPAHASPVEHQARPDSFSRRGPGGDVRWHHPRYHGNFVGWCQYRHVAGLG
jgi:hypothetical protein